MRTLFAATESNGGGSPPLGQELLYNLDLACDISRSSEELGLSQLKTKRAKLTHLNESISKVAEQVEHDREKREHLTSVLSALQRIHNKMDKDSNSFFNGQGHHHFIQMKKVVVSNLDHSSFHYDL